MSQRDSGYARQERDLYETPEWVTLALLPHLRLAQGAEIWEPACATGKMSRVLERSGFSVLSTDICPRGYGDQEPGDFFRWTSMRRSGVITNPPYEAAQAFCEHALRLMEPRGGLVAMLLRTDFDHARSRSHLFRDCPAFAKKIVLLKRIVWFVEDDGKPKASPSFNHAWFLWDWQHEGAPNIAYAA